MKEYIKQIIDIIKANGLTGIQIDLVRNTISEQRSIDDDQLIDTSDPAMQEAFTGSQCLSRKETAEMLRCSTSTVDYLITVGQLKSRKLSPTRCGRVVIDRKSVMEVIHKRCQIKTNDGFDVDQAIADIRANNPEIQQEDVKVVDEDVPEGYYSAGQVEAILGTNSSCLAKYMRSNHIRIKKVSAQKQFYNKEDVDNYVAKKYEVSSYVTSIDLARSLGISRHAIIETIVRGKFKTVRFGNKLYLPKEAESKIRELYRYVNGSDEYVSLSEIQTILNCTLKTATTFVDKNNISNTGKVVVNGARRTLYNRAEFMAAIERRNKSRSLEKYEITIKQLEDLYGCSSMGVWSLLYALNISPSRRMTNYRNTGSVNVYDLRELIEKCKHNDMYQHRQQTLQRELERREAL